MVDNSLPPGFRFYPSDEELVVHFLQRKVSLLPCHPDIIPDLGLYPYDPWELDGKALSEGKQRYYYSRRTQNRSTSNGYWKRSDEPVAVTNSCGRKVGSKKYLFFYYVGGDACESSDDGIKTNWMMEEYTLFERATSSSSRRSSSSSSSKPRRGNSKQDWVICRVSEQNGGDDGPEAELSCLDEIFLSLDDLDEISLPN